MSELEHVKQAVEDAAFDGNRCMVRMGLVDMFDSDRLPLIRSLDGKTRGDKTITVKELSQAEYDKGVAEGEANKTGFQGQPIQIILTDKGVSTSYVYGENPYPSAPGNTQPWGRMFPSEHSCALDMLKKISDPGPENK